MGDSRSFDTLSVSYLYDIECDVLHVGEYEVATQVQYSYNWTGAPITKDYMLTINNRLMLYWKSKN